MLNIEKSSVNYANLHRRRNGQGGKALSYAKFAREDTEGGEA